MNPEGYHSTIYLADPVKNLLGTEEHPPYEAYMKTCDSVGSPIRQTALMLSLLSQETQEVYTQSNIFQGRSRSNLCLRAKQHFGLLVSRQVPENLLFQTVSTNNSRYTSPVGSQHASCALDCLVHTTISITFTT